MKKTILSILLGVLLSVGYSQDTSNFYTIKATWDTYFDSIIEIRGLDSMQGTGYNPYMRKADYWEPKLYPHGDFSIWYNGVSNYLNEFIENGDNTSDVLDWKLIGPDRMPEDGYQMNPGNNENSIKGLGQIHYIEFDPRYAPPINSKMFACSPAGGLFVSDNGGESWTNGGTDLELPISGVSSIAIDEHNPDDNWFITTGCAEGMPGHLWWQNAIGVWRTTNGGEDWEYIGLNETLGGNKIHQMRKIISIPTDPGKVHLFVVTNKGLYECEDALVPFPVWEEVCSGNFYDIEVHPDPSTNLIYASGTGSTSVRVIDYQANPTECNFLPNLDFLPDPTDNTSNRRITIEFSPAAPEYLFIVVSFNMMWDPELNNDWNSRLFRYDLVNDVYVDKGALPIQEGATVCNAGVNPERGLGWAIAPMKVGEKLWMVHGNTAPIYAASDLLDEGFCTWSLITAEHYFDMEIHVDQHFMEIVTEGEDLVLWVGNDGGVYKTVLDHTNPSENYDWQEMNNGLAVATVYDIATSKENRNVLLSGQHDNGSNIYELREDKTWAERHVQSGDGFKPDMDNTTGQNMYVTAQHFSCRYSEDGGENFSFFTPKPENVPNWRTYFTINPGNPSEILVCGNELKRENTNNWNTKKWGLKKFVNGEWERWERFENQIEIVDNTEWDDPSTWRIEISETNPNIIYVIWRGGKGDEPTIPLRVFKSNTGGGTGANDWVDLGAFEGTTGWMTDIAIDYDNPDHFYVAQENYIYFCNSENSGTPIWTEYNNFPANQSYKIYALGFVNGSSDKSLYVGTNYGLFYINENLVEFENVSGNLPHVPIRDLEINSGKKTIAVGTFGRGVWEADLPCNYNPVPEIIEGVVNYELEHHAYSDIVINSGGVLNITGTLFMGEGRSIKVKRGGLLVIDGGTISNECAGMWQGIQVWGDPTKAHTFPNQGKVIIRNEGRIEMAKYGIRTVKVDGSGQEEIEFVDLKYSGGIVNIVNADFHNNFNSILFYRYPAAGFSYESGNFIYSSDFTIDINYPIEQGEVTFISMREIDKVRLNGNNFSNNSKIYQYGTGIKSFNSTFFVDGLCLGGNPCEEWEYGEFFNLNYGIYSTASSSIYYTDIRHTKINDTYYGIYCGSLSNARITSNEFFFYKDSPVDSWGLYLDSSTGYHVEDNEFINVYGAQYWGIGIIINDSREPMNEIYNNYFEKLRIGTSAQNCNRSILQQDGLKIRCNNYVMNNRDIYVTAEPGCVLPGISYNQGAPGATDMQAGNTFSLHNTFPLVGPEFSDYENIDLLDAQITYYHHFHEPVNIVPEYRSPEPFIILENEGTFYEKTQSCPSGISGESGGSAGGDHREGMAENKIAADSVQSIFLELIDGGNTVLLEQQVLQSMPPEAYEVYMSLSNKSPYLSDSVLIAALEKEDVLPNVLIKDILVANPQSAKSQEVMDKVEEKSQPFTQEMLAEILLGKYMVAAKEKLEAQRGMYNHKRAMALNNLKRYYLADTINVNSFDSLIVLLEEEAGLHEKYELVFSYIKNNQFTEAMDVFGMIPTQYILDGQQQNFYDDLINYLEVVEELHIADTGIYGLTEIQKEILIEMADNNQTNAAAYSRNILVHLGEYDYSEPVLMPDDGMKSNSINETKKVAPKSFSKVNIYPNPADEYIVIDLLIGNVEGARVDIYDIQGRQIKTFNIDGQKQQQILSVKDIPTGVYLIRTYCGGKTIGVEKATIKR